MSCHCNGGDGPQKSKLNKQINNNTWKAVNDGVSVLRSWPLTWDLKSDGKRWEMNIVLCLFTWLFVMSTWLCPFRSRSTSLWALCLSLSPAPIAGPVSPHSHKCWKCSILKLLGARPHDSDFITLMCSQSLEPAQLTTLSPTSTLCLWESCSAFLGLRFLIFQWK